MSVIGEYWIQGKTAIFADGDISDDNHEAVVFKHVLSSVASQMMDSDRWNIIGSMLDDYVESGDAPMIREAICNWSDEAQKTGEITEDEADDIYTTIAKDLGISKEEMQIAFWQQDCDLRDYGMRNLEWHRVADSYIQVYRLSKKTLAELTEGLYDAFDTDCLTAKFNIEESSTGKIWQSVPYEAIADCSLAKMRKYQQLESTFTT